MKNFIHTINAKLIFYDMFFNCFIYQNGEFVTPKKHYQTIKISILFMDT